MHKTLILTVGLPRSGKSTWALGTGLSIVNRDAIRLALHGQAYIQAAEDMVTAIELYMVKALFIAGHDFVIIDAMNLKGVYRERWADGPWDIKVKTFQVRPDICIKRAKEDGREDLIPFIEKNAPLAADLSFLTSREYTD